MASESKTAEFARLLNFFERLAAYKSRPRTHINEYNDASIDKMGSVPLPADLVPIVNSLENLVNTRVHITDARKDKTTGRKRSHTISTTPCNSYGIDLCDSDAKSVAKFPLEKKYIFTFRFMLHKLYQIDDWKQKVEDVLERSQNEYRPLSETIAAAKAKKQTKEEQGRRKQDGPVHFKTDTPVSPRRPGIRPRTYSALALGKINEMRSSFIHLKSPKSPMVLGSCPPAEEDIRVLKKRCVGRKSVSAMSTDGGRFGSEWIYDAEVSAAEIVKREVLKHREMGLERQLGNAVLEVARPDRAGEKHRGQKYTRR